MDEKRETVLRLVGSINISIDISNVRVSDYTQPCEFSPMSDYSSGMLRQRLRSASQANPVLAEAENERIQSGTVDSFSTNVGCVNSIVGPRIDQTSNHFEFIKVVWETAVNPAHPA